ncbi:hypothetical protein MT418_003707 [Batrachochytrium dendrobatidis]
MMVQQEKVGIKAPVKNVRSSSGKRVLADGGGLTPLPSEDQDYYSIYLPTIQRVGPEGVKLTQDAEQIRCTDGQSKVGISLKAEELKIPSPLAQSTHTSTIKEFVGNILSRQDQLCSTQPEAQEKLENLKNAINTHNTSLISFELDHALALPNSENVEATEADRKLNYKIQQGFIKIKELDVVLVEKLATARTLKKERLIRDSVSGTPNTVGTPGSISYHNTLSDDDDDFELRSVHSMDKDIFITEPKLSMRSKVGRESLGQKRKQNPIAISNAESGKLKSYQQGDFISRNIILGPDARYYSAMTDEEIDRVNRLIANNDDEPDKPASSHTVSKQQVIASVVSQLNTLQSSLLPEGNELTLLQRIDNQLCDFVPQDQWEERSLVWSTSTTPGHHTPMTRNWLRSGAQSAVFSDISKTSKDLETILRDTKLPTSSISVFSDLNRLKQIDDQLEQLDNQDTRPLTREDLQILLSDYRCSNVHLINGEEQSCELPCYEE